MTATRKQYTLPFTLLDLQALFRFAGKIHYLWDENLRGWNL